MKNLDLGKDKISKLLLTFAIPCVISMLVSALYNIVDQIFIGQGVGFLGNAATNVVYPFTVIALAFSLLIGDGSAALFSLSLGKDDKKSANKSVVSCIIMLFVAAIIITAVGFLFKDSILKIFGVTDSCYNYAQDYMTFILFGIPFSIITAGLNGIIRADGSPKYSMIATLVGAIVNIILDPIAIFALNLGVKGAAIATVVGQVISCIVTLLYLRKSKNFKLSKNDFSIEYNIMKKISMLGISSFITQASIVVVIAVSNNLIVKYGPLSEYGADIPLSVIGIVMKVFGIVIAFIIGISVGGQPIIGYNYGALNIDRVKQTYKNMIIANLIVGFISTILVEFFPHALISIFGSESALYNEYAVLCFRIYLAGILLCCFTKTTSIFLQSIGSSLKSTLLSILRDIVVFIPFLILFANINGVVGMLWAALVADVVSFILSIIFAISEIKHMTLDEPSTTLESDKKHQTELLGKKHIVVTISREYGSGGRYVGKILAEKLGISFYDKDLIKLVAEESGFSEKYIEKNEDKTTITSSNYNKDDQLFIAESNVIKKIAKSSCVIIGRCADYILKDNQDVFNVFVYSDEDSKIDRVVNYYHIPKNKAKKDIEKKNKDRAKHYNHYTNQKWADFNNYDLAINSDYFGVEKTAEIIKNILVENHMNKNN